MLSGEIHPPIGYGTYKVGYIPTSSAAVKEGSEDAGGNVDCKEVR